MNKEKIYSINSQLAYKDCLEKHKQYFEKDFIKDKTLKDIIYELTRKMFLNFGKSMFMCILIDDILSYAEENRTITRIKRSEIEKTCKRIENIRLLNLKIANEINKLTEYF